MIDYHPTNYRKNIVTYWRQYNPLYEIPREFVVHHITPKSICEQEDWSIEDTNHPRNLIALHPDDHIAIHKNRGDRYATCGVMLINDLDRKIIGQKISKAHNTITSDGRTKAQVRIAKAVETKRDTIDPNTGLNIHQQAGKQSIETRRNTIDPVTGLSELDMSTRKGIETKRTNIDADNGLNILQSIGIKSAETRADKQLSINKKISDSNTGKILSNEHRKNIGLAQTGANNNHYSGDYITPWGVFESTYQAANECPVGIVYQTIRTWCKNNQKTVKRINVTMSDYLQEDNIGKTFEELGFQFVRDITFKV